MPLGQGNRECLYLLIFGVERCVIIGMMLKCSASGIVEYDKRRSGLFKTPLDMEYNNNIIER